MANGQIISFPGQKTQLTEDVVVKNFEERLAQIERYVLENPTKSLVIALAMGLLIGFLGRRS